MNLKEAMKRIEELERKVRELEARPVYMPMLQYIPYYIPPTYIPSLIPYYPSTPMPWQPPWIITCTVGAEGANMGNNLTCMAQ